MISFKHHMSDLSCAMNGPLQDQQCFSKVDAGTASAASPTLHSVLVARRGILMQCSMKKRARLKNMRHYASVLKIKGIMPVSAAAITSFMSQPAFLCSFQYFLMSYLQPATCNWKSDTTLSYPEPKLLWLVFVF